MRFVFRRSGSLVGLYVGLILAYGSVGYFKSHLGIETVRRMLTGVVTASALLHFYYDGFIWKVREKSTRQSLGIAGGMADAITKGFLPSWALHGAKWVAVFVIPLGALWLGQARTVRSELARLAMIVADLPTGVRSHFNYATALQTAGQSDQAVQEFSTALRFNPNSAQTQMNLASALMNQGRLSEAQGHLDEALRIQPNNAELHSNHAYLLDQLGRPEEAAAECEAAIRIEPRSAAVRHGYGAFLEKHGKLDEAIDQYRQSVQADPHFADAQLDLATALLTKGNLQEAKIHFLEGSRLEPKLAQPHNYLGEILMREGQISQAVTQFEEALRLHPDFPEAKENLRVAEQTQAASPH
jgi:tetratricopeptide (TPR) repeat protein